MQDIKDFLARICQDRQEILAAYIFGSIAKGKVITANDIDIAVLLEEQKENDFDYLKFKVDLERGLNKEVDLIVLNNAGEILKHQVRRDGIIAFDREPKKRKLWEIRSRKFYQDYLHLHSIYMRTMYKSLRARYGR